MRFRRKPDPTEAASARRGSKKLPLRKRILFLLAANLLGLAVIALVGEVVCRLFAPQTEYGTFRAEGLRFCDDLYLGWELQPRVSELQHNAAGFRGDEAATAKPDGRWRIAVLGDSVTYGLHVQAAEAYPNVLQQELTAAGTGPVEVLNFGVPGYSTYQELTLLKTKVLDYDPDLVILTFTTDDVETSPVVIEVGGQPCLFRNQFEGVGLLNNSAHWSLFRRSHFYRLLYKGAVLAFATRGADFEAVYVRPEVTWQNVLAAAEVCRKNDTPLLLVLSPYLLPHASDNDSEGRREIEQYEEALDQIRRLAAESSMETLDLGPLYAEHAGRMKVRPDDQEHLSVEGHTLVAAALAEKVRAMRE